ncbi:MAG TPA: hypothetical protein VLA24_12765 [Pseudomonadales bacterium]|nr:hypothetical protein [Pseudomonadales bacterium]
MTLEKTITNNIMKRLNALDNCKAIKLHGSPYTVKGTPDILCVCEGVAIFIEVKQPGNQPTPAQNHQLREWDKAGASCFVAYNADTALEVVKIHMRAKRKLMPKSHDKTWPVGY